MSVLPLTLDLELCRQRQRRLCAVLQKRDVDAAVFSAPETIQYLTGFRPHRLMSAAMSLNADGRCSVATPNAVPEHIAADEVVTFEAQWCCTLRQDQPQAAAMALRDALASHRLPQRAGAEFSTAGPDLLRSVGFGDFQREADGRAATSPQRQAADRTRKLIDLEPELWQLRRSKDADELAMIRRAIECTAAMYQTARDCIEPGITELDVYSRLHAAAVEAAGEPLTALGNDFQCNSPGGPPRDRAAGAGELFILDLGPAYRGYYADNCRTFSVDRHPTDEQSEAWAAIVAVLEMVEATVRPGVSARELFRQARAMLDDTMPGAFFHHLGHGIGLYPHETPHLNDHWDDTFQAGDVFTAEPGLYHESLRAGIRLEQNYLVTQDGVERLTSFPLDL